MSEDGPTVEDVKRALAMLAAEESVARCRETINIAWEATHDVECAAAFVTTDGLARLDQAIDLAGQLDDRQLLRDGQHALTAFERFSWAAGNDPNQNGTHLQDGHGIDLMEETKRGDR